MERRNAWKVYDQTELEKLDKINETYKNCLDDGKTERECITLAVKKAEAAGYKNLKELQKEHVKLKAGDKVYAVCMDKSIALFIIGQEPLENGMNILGAHIDSPRIDVKQNPLYENEELAYLDTHYYGGIKKYQWVTLPLALHGVIAKKDGTIVPVSIGDEEEDPVFVITDLLVHLASKQLEKKGSVVVEGEKLDLLIGSRPLEQDPSLDQEEKEAVKANVMELLKKISYQQNLRLFRQEKQETVVLTEAWCWHTVRMTVFVHLHLCLQFWIRLRSHVPDAASL